MVVGRLRALEELKVFFDSISGLLLVLFTFLLSFGSPVSIVIDQSRLMKKQFDSVHHQPSRNLNLFYVIKIAPFFQFFFKFRFTFI